MEENQSLLKRRGRPPKIAREQRTRREIKEQELQTLLRKLKPHVAVSITSVAKMLTSSSVTDTNKLKAAEFIVDTYKEIIEELFEQEGTLADPLGKEPDTSENTNSEGAAVLSLRVVGDDNK